MPTNHDIAKPWAKKHGASLIENIPLGHFLDKFNKVGTFDYYPTFDEAIRPWKELSRLYALSMWGCVSTTVCGANPEGVYGSIEITNTINPHHSDIVPPTAFDKAFYDALLNSGDFFDLRKRLNPDDKPVRCINLRPYSEFEDLYDPSNLMPVHRFVCLSEQRMALHEALSFAEPKTIKAALAFAAKEVCTNPVEAYEYYLDSQERYLLDWKNMMKNAPPSVVIMPSDQRAQNKEARLQAFGGMVWNLIDTELSMMPPSARPKINIPPVLKRAGIVP